MHKKIIICLIQDNDQFKAFVADASMAGVLGMYEYAEHKDTAINTLMDRIKKEHLRKGYRYKFIFCEEFHTIEYKH